MVVHHEHGELFFPRMRDHRRRQRECSSAEAPGEEPVDRTGRPDPELMAPEFVWDMTNFHGWPEQQSYEGLQGTLDFLGNWTSAWDDWELEMEELHDAGDRVAEFFQDAARDRADHAAVIHDKAMFHV